jgi:hypothetical protein
MGRWWRAYSASRNDPKIQTLSGDQFKAWYNLLCLAAESDGEIKSATEAAYALHMPESKARAMVAILAGKGLLDIVSDGYFKPHNWDCRQYKSNVSTERVQQFRKRKRNVSSIVSPTVSETPPETETETETETEKKDIRAVADATRPLESSFEEFWEVYPRRDGANPKAPARKKFDTIVKSGVDPNEIVAAAGRYAAEARSKGQEQTQFVAQAMTWLNQQRWGDYPEKQEQPEAISNMFRIELDTPQWDAWRKYRGASLPSDRDGGWWCETEWPPDYGPEKAVA